MVNILGYLERSMLLEKGRFFNPNARMKKILEDSAKIVIGSAQAINSTAEWRDPRRGGW